ncbi:MAG: hypothetical protein ACYSWP_19900 [Planctomycetota bacterium]|jgi:hypothetical protein
MFTGIQEILVLVAIIVGILFLPRILNRGKAKAPAETELPFVLSGKMRLAIGASIVWPAAVAAYMQPWKNDLYTYLYIGLGPVVLVWIFFWIYTGFRSRER